MATRRNVREDEVVKVEEVVVEEKVEEKGVLGLYQAMLEGVEEMYKVAMELESSEQTAKVLKSVEMLKVVVTAVMEQVRVDEALTKQQEEYEREKSGE